MGIEVVALLAILYSLAVVFQNVAVLLVITLIMLSKGKWIEFDIIHDGGLMFGFFFLIRNTHQRIAR